MKIYHKHSIILFFLIASIYSYGQCTGCQYTITVPNSATHNLTAGQVVCITGTGAFTGRLNNFSGNTLCIGTGVTYNPASTPNYNGNWSIINHGTFQNTGNLNFNSGTSFYNGETGTISLNSINISSGVSFSNYGNLTTTGITLNSNANVILGGTTTINGPLMNNGNLTIIGSVTASSITNNGSGRIIGGPNTGCNYIRSTGSFTNTGIIGVNGTSLLVGNSGGSIQNPASSTVPTAPVAQASNLQLSASGTTINGSFTTTTAAGYLVLRAVAASAPAVTNPANYAALTAGQTLGAWTVLAVNTGQNTNTFSDVIPPACLPIHYRIYSFNAVGNCRVFNISNVLTGSFNPSPTVASVTPASRCGTGSITLAATASMGTLNWYDASSGGTFVGSGTTLTIASLAATTTYYVSATLGSCTSATRTAVTATVSGAVSGTLGNSQELCSGTAVSNLSVTGLSGSIIQWESASDNAFTTGNQTIANTTATLTSSQMGTFSGTRYFRALIGNGTCQTYTNAIYVKYPSTTWSQNSWSDGTPDGTKKVIFNSNYIVNSDLYACSVEVGAGASVTVKSGKNLVVGNEVIVNNSPNAGTLLFESNASLVQSNNDAVNTGNIIYKRKTVPVRRYDYTYWSSPVTSQNILAVSPATLPDKFYHFSPVIGNWQAVAAPTTLMQTGRGYIIRAPQTFDAETPAVYEASFTGVPNNGVISYTIQTGASNFNLLGNPYPSELDIDKFLADPANAGILDGTIYLWTHNTLPSSQIPGNWAYNYTSDDYAAYNSTGGVATRKALSTGISENTPTGKIASGQSFFIQAKGPGTAVFKNSMRQKGTNNDFFRHAAPVANDGTKQRMWLNFINDQGAFKQLLIGYLPEATNGYESRFDGETFNANAAVNFYSVCNDKLLSIQGRSFPFDQSDVITLGFTVTTAGNFTVEIDKTDAFFNTKPIFLKDKLLNLTHNLKNGSYPFSTAAGTFDDRFELRFTESALSNQAFEINPNAIVLWNEAGFVEVASSNYQMQKIEVNDLNGRIIFTAHIPGANHYTITNLAASNQLLFVKITLADHSVIVKKIMKT